MAEAFLRHCGGDRFAIHSAGTEPADEIHPLAIAVMEEVGIDLAGQSPKPLRTFLGRMFVHYLIIVCEAAEQSCPRIFPGTSERLLWPFEDPAAAEGSEEEVLATFRRVRDEIRERIERFLESH